jgi:hypothetical protein
MVILNEYEVEPVKYSSFSKKAQLNYFYKVPPQETGNPPRLVGLKITTIVFLLIFLINP